MELDKNQHSVYSINYHLVMVIKYRKKVISDEISGYLRATFERIGITYGVDLVEWNHDKDHVHVLFKCTPQIAPAKFINELVQDWLKRTILKYVNICGRKLFGLKATV